MEFTDIKNGRFYLADTFEAMKEIPDGVVDMVLCDLPYGATACKWDAVIPFEPLWEEYWRIVKPGASIVLTAAFPFTAALAMSQIRFMRYAWVWNKTRPTGFQRANVMPLRDHEDILVFFKKRGVYNPQGLLDVKRINKRGGPGENWQRNPDVVNEYVQEKTGYPRTVLKFGSENGLHPTQKPVTLFEYLIRTYTNPGSLVLDNTAGSGTTAIAAINSGRRWVCIERDEGYYRSAIERIKAHEVPNA